MGLFSKFFGPPDKNKFAGLLLDAIKKAGETADIRYDAEGFRLVVEGQEKRSVNLANLYQEYCAADSAKREQALRRCRQKCHPRVNKGAISEPSRIACCTCASGNNLRRAGVRNVTSQSMQRHRMS